VLVAAFRNLLFQHLRLYKQVLVSASWKYLRPRRMVLLAELRDRPVSLIMPKPSMSPS
jgi:hypothetical protein